MNPQPSQPRYPRVRIDALTDGIFAVAMTLLVLDIRLPDELHPADSKELLHGVLELIPKLFVYALSFTILGLRWLSVARIPSRAEYLGGSYIKWWLFYLMMTTFVPFTTMLVGTHPGFASALWLYCLNTALIAIASWRMVELTPEIDDLSHVRRRQVSVSILLLSAIVCVVWSLIEPAHALLAFLINLLAPAVSRKFERPGT
jgi:uncharacterized membrane protein